MSEFHQRYRDVSRHGFTAEELGIAEIARINSIVNLVPRTVDTILDVGCGEGLITNPLGQMGFSITGCDISADVYFRREKEIIKKRNKLKEQSLALRRQQYLHIVSV